MMTVTFAFHKGMMVTLDVRDLSIFRLSFSLKHDLLNK